MLKPRGFLKTVTAAGTQEQLSTSNIKVLAVTISAERSNTGFIYVGDSTVSSTNYGVDLDAADSVTFTAPDMGIKHGNISLEDIWIDCSVSGDGVAAMYLRGE